ncbi:TetR/AcrR family transcriptional regulator [Bradyrhizobium sp. CCBAU 51627]|uniref:TetR/AcrR family transcriptional regulator n=1 Tax=Bradyrhizobium sp. CCBAU 51627 TaxID=1325088 RepID=UPI002306DC7D|nr:TetR/AcrR family transcriptional regulator [Bradyrhizobium sp. CCBAU 51627]
MQRVARRRSPPKVIESRPKPAVDPRIERSRQVILQAALDELSESGYGSLTIESVARRAGVGKATIYRHWPDKIALIADAFKLLQQQRDPELVTGSPREKLERVLRHVADVVSDSPFSSCLPALIEGAERDRAVRRFHHHFQTEARKPTIALIADGIATGDFPPRIDPELAAFALLGAIFFCRLMTNAPFPEERVPTLIDTVFNSSG